MTQSWDTDVAIVGSGFGGSVAALRLAEKGLSAVVLEQGRRIGPDEMAAGASDPRRFLWAPALGMDGYFSQVFLRHVTLVRGIAVGGGSIVYGAVLLEPRTGFYADPIWSRLGVDWEAELKPHFRTAKRMLGVTPCPSHTKMDDYLQETARSMGPQASDTFGPTPLGIYFGTAGETVDDPFFGGKGPSRQGCRLCGGCLGGCPYGSKNSLDLTYLHMAEALGTEIRPHHRVERITPLAEGGYALQAVHPHDRTRHPPLRARRVILAAGAVGTLELLFKSRDRDRTLPHISRQLGTVVRTNSESIVAISSTQSDEDLSEGPAISTHFYPNENTHITNNRFPPAMDILKFQVGPLVDGGNTLVRSLKTLTAYVLHPLRSTLAARTRDWHRRVSVLTVMQDLDNRLQLVAGWSLTGWGLKSRRVRGSPAPSYIPEANDAARAFAAVSNGIPGNGLPESLLGASTTAHILGGCHMGRTGEDGVIDIHHEVFGHPGLFVVDGSAVSANVGANPSLTIAAMAERFAAQLPVEPRPL